MVNLRVRAVGSTLARSGPPPAQPYRWRGTPGWDPAAAAAVEHGPGGGRRERKGRAARLERYAQLRAAGTGIVAAGAELALAERTAREYESIITGRAWSH